MNRALPTFPAAGLAGPIDPTNPPRFRVLILYHDLDAARQAMERLARAMRPRARTTVLHPMLWRFDQLEEPRWRDRALLDAVDADCVVFAAATNVAFSAVACDWLLEAVHRRATPVTQIITLSGDEEPWTVAIERRSAASPQAGWQARTGAHTSESRMRDDVRKSA